MRVRRRASPVLQGEARRRALCRSYTNVLVHRGLIVRTRCAECGHRWVQAHHPDYDDPWHVVWLCRDHHGRVHGRRPNGRVALAA